MAVFAPAEARRLLAVRVFGQAGDGLLQTALASFVLFSPERAANSQAIALSFGILLIPYSVIGPFVGVFIDRWQRRVILYIANSVRAVTMIGLAFLVASRAESWQLACLVIVSLGVNRFLQASLAASLPHVVGHDQLVNANALFPTLGTASASIAATTALTFQHFAGNDDTTNSLIISSGVILALIAAYTAASIRPKHLLGPHTSSQESREKLRNVLVGLADGIYKLKEQHIARRSMLAVLLQRFTFGSLTVRTLLLARTVWHPNNPSSSVVDFGIAAGCAAVGAFIAAFISAFLLKNSSIGHNRSLTRQRTLQRTAIVALVGGIVVTDLAMFSNSRLSIFTAAGVLAFAGQLLKISADTNIQTTIDDVHRGRVFSLFDMGINFALVSGIAVTALVPAMMNNLLPVIVLTVTLSASCLAVLTNLRRTD